MTETLNGSLSKSGQQMVGKLSTQPPFQIYDGPYVIVPKTSEQTVPTANKILKEDLSVAAVAYDELPNQAGGLTAAIMADEKENVI